MITISNEYILGSEQLPNESYLNAANCQPGHERYVYFTHHTRSLCQYDYRAKNKELFTTVKPTIEECRQALAEWLKLHI